MAASNSIGGAVKDASGTVIPGVTVSVRNSQTQVVSSAVSDSSGRFAIGNLTPGFYDVTTSLTGFQTFNQRVQLPANGQSSVNPVLQVAMSAELATVTTSRSLNSLSAAKRPGSGVGFGVGGAASASETMNFAAVIPPPPQQVAQAVAAQDYFEYKFPFPVQLEGRQSALLPFLNKPIKAEHVSIFKAGIDRDHLAGTEVPAELRSKLMRIVEERQKLSDLETQVSPLEDLIQSIFEDQSRLRENLKALGNGNEDKALRLKYLTQMDGQEQKVGEARARIEALNQQIERQQALVSRMVSELSWGS